MPPKEEVTDWWKKVSAVVTATLFTGIIIGGFTGFMQTRENQREIHRLMSAFENLSGQQEILKEYMHRSSVYQEQMTGYLRENKEATEKISQSMNAIENRIAKIENIENIK